ncbi:MAG TPA: YwiC-like family protein [Candidatus Angelobacter sp.]|nr:YwiC-like family protein [Candidatus Angelobacter sp.]
MSAQGEITTTRGKARILRFPEVTPGEKRLLVPREHGAWALWLLPLFSGGIVGFASAPLAATAPAIWFSFLAVAAFLIHQPLESLLGVSVVKVRSAREQRVAIFWVMGLTAVAALCVFELVQLERGLILVFAAVAAACFAVAALCGRVRALRIPKQLVGALGLTCTAAGAYYVTTGRFDRVALVLWLASWLFAAGQIEYVQMRLRTAYAKSRREKMRAGWQITAFHLLWLAVAAYAAVMFAAPRLLALAFLPSVLRIFAWMFGRVRPLKLYMLGFTELLQNLVFAVLLTAAFLPR